MFDQSLAHLWTATHFKSNDACGGHWKQSVSHFFSEWNKISLKFPKTDCWHWQSFQLPPCLLQASCDCDHSLTGLAAVFICATAKVTGQTFHPKLHVKSLVQWFCHVPLVMTSLQKIKALACVAFNETSATNTLSFTKCLLHVLSAWTGELICQFALKRHPSATCFFLQGNKSANTTPVQVWLHRWLLPRPH